MKSSTMLLKLLLGMVLVTLCYSQVMSHRSKSKRKGMRCKMMQQMESQMSLLRNEVDMLSNPIQIHVHGVSQNMDNIVARYNVQEGHNMKEEHDVEKHGHSHGHNMDETRKRDRERHHKHHTSEKSSEEEDRSYEESEERSGGTHVHIHLNVGGIPIGEASEPTHHHHEKEGKVDHMEKPTTGHLPPEYDIYPKDEYLHARCDVMRNSVIDTPHNVLGTVYLRQKPSQNLEIKVDIYGFYWGARGGNPEGTKLHGIHVHEYGDYSNGCNSFGGHYNPEGASHGGLEHDHRHVGDWGNLEIDRRGAVITEFTDKHSSLIGSRSIMGRGIVIHESVDDHGEGGSKASKASGNAGKRIACCVIAWYSGDVW